MDPIFASFFGGLLESVAPLGRVAISMGVSAVGSYAQGKLVKHKTPLPNKGIPAYNTATWTGGAAALTQDPESIGGAFLGSMLAWGIHRVQKKVSSN